MKRFRNLLCLTFALCACRGFALDSGYKAPPFVNLDLEVVVFATDPEGAEVVAPFFENQPTPLKVLLDYYQVTVKKYGVGEIPSLFLVDPDGIIVHKEVGYREDLYEIISSLLGS